MQLSGKLVRRMATIVKEDDMQVIDGKPTDLIIAIMGPTGAGKSSFINTYFGKKMVEVGHELSSCTAQLKYIIHPSFATAERRIILVDTPGFDDTYVDDAEILRRISSWLATSYTKDMKLTGIIYLHEISQARMLGTMRKNLDLFRKLCGDSSLSSVVLGTTKWSEVERDVGINRLQQLKQTFWKEMIDGGSKAVVFDNTRESASAMVDYLLKKNDSAFKALRLQEELVVLLKILPDTDAGKELRYTLEELQRMQKDKATDEQIKKTLKAIQALKVPISLRLKLFFHLA